MDFQWNFSGFFVEFQWRLASAARERAQRASERSDPKGGQMEPKSGAIHGKRARGVEPCKKINALPVPLLRQVSVFMFLAIFWVVFLVSFF